MFPAGVLENFINMMFQILLILNLQEWLKLVELQKRKLIQMVALRRADHKWLNLVGMEKDYTLQIPYTVAGMTNFTLILKDGL